MSSYSDLLHRHQKEVNAFPIKWAFSDSQFNQAMRELGLDPRDTDAIIGIGGGGFMRKSDNEAFHAMLDRHQQERAEAIASDKDGTGYLYEMFLYELGNHEYIFTFDPDETFSACGVTAEQVENDPVMKLAFATAKRDYLKRAEEENWG